MWLKSADANIIVDGAHMLKALAEYSKFTCYYLTSTRMLTSFSGTFQKTIIEESCLVTGLGCHNEQAEDICASTLYDLANNGSFML